MLDNHAVRGHSTPLANGTYAIGQARENVRGRGAGEHELSH